MSENISQFLTLFCQFGHLECLSLSSHSLLLFFSFSFLIEFYIWLFVDTKCFINVFVHVTEKICILQLLRHTEHQQMHHIFAIGGRTKGHCDPMCLSLFLFWPILPLFFTPSSSLQKRTRKGFLSGQRRVLLTPPPHLTPTLAIL